MAVSLLVIGYGNALRGDDGAGLRAAQLIGARRAADQRGVALRALAVHQLLPELVDDIARAAHVVFIDAYAASEAGSEAGSEAAPLRVDAVQAVQAVEVRVEAGTPTHTASPAALLALCARLYARSPQAWVVGIPAYDFALGAEISPRTARRIDDAVDFCLAQGER